MIEPDQPEDLVEEPSDSSPKPPDLDDDEGGDPPCWDGLVEDHRDRPAD